MIEITLYTTAGCHLCELADALLQQVNQATVKPIEIGDNDALVERYGIIIPVLKFADDVELHWPFSVQDIEFKIKQLNNTTIN